MSFHIFYSWVHHTKIPVFDYHTWIILFPIFKHLEVNIVWDDVEVETGSVEVDHAFVVYLGRESYIKIA